MTGMGLGWDGRVPAFAPGILDLWFSLPPDSQCLAVALNRSAAALVAHARRDQSRGVRVDAARGVTRGIEAIIGGSDACVAYPRRTPRTGTCRLGLVRIDPVQSVLKSATAAAG